MRTLQSLLAGLMWIGIKDGRYFMRHVCQDSDELTTYGWTHHNGSDYGHQVLVDQDLTLTTSFLKSKAEESGYGGNYAVQLEAKNKKTKEDTSDFVHMFFYMADEGGNTLNLGSGHTDQILAWGTRNDIGSWQLHFETKDEFEFHCTGFKTKHIHNLSDLVQTNLGNQLSDTSDDAPNILVFQISARVPFKADVAFVSGSGSTSSRAPERVRKLTGDSLSSHLDQKRKQFEDKFQNCFNMSHELELGDNYISYWPAELYKRCQVDPSFRGVFVG